MKHQRPLSLTRGLPSHPFHCHFTNLFSCNNTQWLCIYCSGLFNASFKRAIYLYGQSGRSSNIKAWGSHRRELYIKEQLSFCWSLGTWLDHMTRHTCKHPKGRKENINMESYITTMITLLFPIYTSLLTAVPKIDHHKENPNYTTLPGVPQFDLNMTWRRAQGDANRSIIIHFSSI